VALWPHWASALQARVAFPYSLPTEASTLGGGVWQDNLDGAYTQLRDGYLVPAAGYSYLDLYLMGFISAAEVPDFFILYGVGRSPGRCARPPDNVRNPVRQDRAGAF